MWAAIQLQEGFVLFVANHIGNPFNLKFKVFDTSDDKSVKKKDVNLSAKKKSQKKNENNVKGLQKEGAQKTGKNQKRLAKIQHMVRASCHGKAQNMQIVMKCLSPKTSAMGGFGIKLQKTGVERPPWSHHTKNISVKKQRKGCMCKQAHSKPTKLTWAKLNEFSQIIDTV